MATYKENLKAQLEKEKSATEKAVGIFLDTAKSKEKRLKAFAESGTFNEASDISEALKTVRNENEDAEIRAAAILGLNGYAGGSEEFVEELLDLLNNENTPDKMKGAAMTVLQSNTFNSPILDAKKPEYNNALRNLVESDCPNHIKLRAAEYLAIEKDDYIQRKLLEGLENPKEKIVKPEVAIQLLSYDLHSDVYPVLRKIAENPPNKRAKKEAIRNLSADPDSAGYLQKVLDDKKEDKEIRHAAAVGLQSVEPEKLQESVKEILTDKKEDEELRVALLNTLNYTPETANADNDQKFQAELEEIKDKSKSRNFKKMYRFYEENKLKK